MSLFARCCLIVLLYSVQAIALAVPQQFTSSMSNADFAVARSGPAGNIHMVWTQDDTTDGRSLHYMMRTASGTVLIDDTRIDNGGTGGPAGYPSIAVDVSGHVYVVWQAGSSREVYFMRLNPSLDDRNGNAAVLTTIKEVDDVMISGAGGDEAVHPRMEADSSGNLRVVWESNCTGPVQYLTVDTNGVSLNGPLDLGPTGSCNGYPDIALDSNGNAHVVFANGAATTADEVYYTMVDGSNASVLIDATLLTLDDGLLAGNATVSINTATNQAFVVYKQETGAGGSGSEEIFIDTLDPALDDQNGSVADPAVLRINQQQFTNGEGLYRWHVFSRIGQDRRVDIFYMDFDDSACPASVYTIQHAQLLYDGTLLLHENLSTTAQSCAAWVRMSHSDNRVVWADSAAGSQEIFSGKIDRADAGSSGYFACSLTAVQGSATRAGDLWLLLVGIAALGIRTLRKRSLNQGSLT
jgi:hypothetical protein